MTTAIQHAQYLESLRRFDWGGEAIENAMAYRNWRSKLEVLRSWQAECDPTGAEWIAIRPQAFDPASPWYDPMRPGPVVQEVAT